MTRRVALHRLTLGASVLLLAGAAPASRSAWFGTWKLRLASPADKPETLIYSDVGGGAMRMVSVEDRRELVTRFDGRPAADHGQGAAPGDGLAIRATSPTSYTWTFLKAGKPYVRGRNILAPDRRSFMEVSWPLAKRGRTVTLVYDRQ